MNIIIGYPPNFKQIKEVFNPAPNIVFTYGDTIYNPGGDPISHDLEVHEATHMRQQGMHPNVWWDNYIKDPIFRLNEEVQAYQNQYKDFCSSHKDKNQRMRFLIRISRALSGPIYGNIIDMPAAMKLIKC